MHVKFPLSQLAQLTRARLVHSCVLDETKVRTLNPFRTSNGDNLNAASLDNLGFDCSRPLENRTNNKDPEKLLEQIAMINVDRELFELSYFSSYRNFTFYNIFLVLFSLFGSNFSFKLGLEGSRTGFVVTREMFLIVNIEYHPIFHKAQTHCRWSKVSMFDKQSSSDNPILVCIHPTGFHR